jgi:hypothetical protein
VKKGNGDLLTDSHNIFIGWKNYFPQLLNAHTLKDDRQIETYTAEPLVPKLKSQGAEKVLPQLLQKKRKNITI